MSDQSGELKCDLTIRTAGGLWSKKVTDVKINRLKWHTTDGDEASGLGPETFVEVYFDPKTWNVEKDGLLYTDAAFEAGLKAQIEELVRKDLLPSTLLWDKISYTEQGMQHHRYVHMILGSW